jgi:hypothetical protein
MGKKEQNPDPKMWFQRERWPIAASPDK